MARNVKLLDLFTCVHGVITLGCLMYFMAVSSAQFDSPELQSTFIAEAAGVTTNVLMSPAQLFWTSWASKYLPHLLEGLLFVGNSALWGLVATITNRISGRQHGRQIPRGGF